MKMSLFFGVLGLCLAVAAGFGQDVRHDTYGQTDFSRYKTYQWAALRDSPQVSSPTDQRIKDAVDAELAARGLTKVEADTADLVVAYQASLHKEVGFASFSSGYEYRGSGPRPWDGVAWKRGYFSGQWKQDIWYLPVYTPEAGRATTVTSGTILYIGRLILDLYDPAQQAVIWRGVANKITEAEPKPERQQKDLVKSVKKLLKKLPKQPSGAKKTAGE